MAWSMLPSESYTVAHWSYASCVPMCWIGVDDLGGEVSFGERVCDCLGVSWLWSSKRDGC